MTDRPRPRSRATSLLLAGLLAWPLLAQQPASQPPAAPPGPEDAAARPGWLESLLYNPAERTRTGSAAVGAGAPRAAAGALDTAVRLDPASDRARYNAGTAHLLASDEMAAPLLESATRSSDPAVAARAFYNLGNSRLAGQDLPGAVEAYEDSLRRDPSSADAKFNLELALRRLQEQQQDQQKQDQQKQDQQKQDQQKQDQDQNQDQQQEQQKQEQQQQQGQQDQEKQDQQQQQGQEGDDSPEKEGQQGQQQPDPPKPGQEGQQPPPQPGQGEKGKEGPLPQFRDLPDMDAQQAAAILEAIENLERSQRREDAKKALKANASGKKDW